MENAPEFSGKQTLRNRVQLRKELYAFTLSQSEDLMTHIMRFDELCSRLAAVSEAISEDERLLSLLGSLPQEYDSTVRIIEEHGKLPLLDAKEILCREYGQNQKREEEEQAYKASTTKQGAHGGRGGRGFENKDRRHGKNNYRDNQDHQTNKNEFRGKCFKWETLLVTNA